MMRSLRKNDGFTLVELLVTIVVGSIAAMAAATVLILGLRIYNNANETALKQNQVQIGISVIENLVAEQTVKIEDNAVTDASGNILVKHEGEEIVINGATAILQNVTDFLVTNEGDVLKFSLEINNEKWYYFSVYCRLGVNEPAETPTDPPDPSTESSEPTASEEEPSVPLPGIPEIEAVLTKAVEDDSLSLNVRTFLNVLSSQRESTGRIQTPEGEGEYYSEWYIGGYENNPDWNKDTPWCACFVSWALEQCSGYIEEETPRYANVDTFWADLVTTQNWKTEDPAAGDLIFFDWIADDAYNPQHIGVVIGVDDSWVYTIEGNVGGQVALCSYGLDDERILGYGLVNWTK